IRTASPWKQWSIRLIPEWAGGMSQTAAGSSRINQMARWESSREAQESGGGCDGRDLLVPQHPEVSGNHFRLGREVEPDLEQLERIGAFWIEEREHLRAHDPAALVTPLPVPLALGGGGA